MKLSQLKDVAMIGALIGAAVLAYRYLNKVPEALTKTGEAIGSSVYNLFNPNPVGETLFYTVHFSNGNHAIPSSTVDSQGYFTYLGKKFQMRDKLKPDGSREHWAFTA